MAFHLTPLQRSGRATLHACELQTREQERSMGWMTLIVIELLGGWRRRGARTENEDADCKNERDCN